MNKIVAGALRFQTQVFPEHRDHFRRLTDHPQSPRALFITCADSRINPNLITQTEPGELFILRNAGNIVPAYGAANSGEAATIEYAVTVLRVHNIVLCGHTHCGAMKALLEQDSLLDLPAFRAWFHHAEATRRIVAQANRPLTPQARYAWAIEQNVLVQLDNLRTHPSVAAGLARGELNLFGWVYHMDTGEIAAYDSATHRFAPLSASPPAPVPPPALLDAVPVA